MSRAPVLHREARLSLASTIPSQVLQINTSSTQLIPTFGAGRKRGFDEISGLDEESYARKHLATEGSVFFRRKSRAPRSFLWRVLDDRKVLEVQSVDLVHDHTATRSESRLTFRISLPSEVVKNGVAFADPDETDALEAFVLLASNELYTFTLKRDLLTRDTVPGDFDATTCLKKYSSSSLAFRHPYRLVAASSLELLISLHDGGLLRLQRQANQSGAQWRETFFSEGGWSGTLRGLIPLKRRQTVRYGNLDLEQNAMAAVAKSPDGNYIWTVGLDLDLKAWSTETGQPVSHLDILNQTKADEGGKKQQKYIMDAEQGTLLQVVTLPRPRNSRSVAKMDEDGKYYLILHSPKDHQFKFYETSTTWTSVEGKDITFQDIQPGAKLIPPIDDLLNTNIWHLEEFFVQPGLEWENSQIWIRARSGTVCKTFTLTFSLLEDAELREQWQSGWTVVDPGTRTAEAIRESVDCPNDRENLTVTPVTPSEKWLDFLFCSGRFSTVSIETALHIYRKGRGLLTNSSAKGLNTPEAPLKERLVQAITSKIILRRLSREQPDYDRYQAEVQARWKTFFSVLSHLHDRRHESIGFAFDPEDALPWSIFADFVAPVRTTSYFERLSLNNHIFQDDRLETVDANVFKRVFPDEEAIGQSHLLAVAKEFCDRLPAEFKEKFKGSVANEALGHEAGDRERSAKRVQALYEMSNINAEVMDDDFQALENSTEAMGGLGNLSDDFIVGLLELMDEKTDAVSKDHKSLNRYGDNFILVVAQETYAKDHATLLELLALVVFTYGDLDQAELHPDFVAQIGPIYDAIIVRIKHVEMLSWLARHEIPEREKQHRSSSKVSQSLETESTSVNLLERIAIGDFDPRSKGEESVPELLTLWSKQWTYAASLHHQWDGVTGHIMAVLIKERCYDLANEFQKFLTPEENSSGWVKYLEGRLAVAMGDYALASLKFRSAAPDMAEATSIASADTADLLSAEEKNYFGDGLPRFYQHVSTLFEKLKVFSYTADFVQLALEQLENDPNFTATMEDLDRRKAMSDSPALTRTDAGRQEISILRRVSELREELYSRLFNPLLQTGRFRAAFDALMNIEELPIKKANLKELIEKCVKQEAVSEMLALPFEEAKLVQEADATLLAMAKKGLASGSVEGTPYYQILYAFRTQRSDFRGAAGILHEHLERLRYTHYRHGLQDPEDETLVQAYVLLINTLACCGQEHAWLLADPIDGVHGTGTRRRLVTSDDVRKEYGAELDKRSDILQGRFPLVGGGDEMDVL